MGGYVLRKREVGMLLESDLQLEDATGPVRYTVAAAIFRTGEGITAHFFLAVRQAIDAWVILDSEHQSLPMTLRQLRGKFGSVAVGVMCVQTNRPADVGHPSLQHWLDSQHEATAVRCADLHTLHASSVAV